MMHLPIEIECPECKSTPGQRCRNTEEQHKRFHMISYSFHFKRIFKARQQGEQERDNNATGVSE
jgi:hypothetical protein